jgi:gas vesicle protein
MNDRIYYSREAEERASRERTVAVLLFLAFGVGIGAAIALLFAPESGEKTRRELAHSVEGSVETGREAVEPALHRLEKEFGELRKRVDDRINDLR